MEQSRFRFENGIEMTCMSPGLSIFRSSLAYVWILRCHSKKKSAIHSGMAGFFLAIGELVAFSWFYFVRIYIVMACVFSDLTLCPRHWTAIFRIATNVIVNPPISHFSFICVPPFLTPFISPWLNVCYWSCISCHEHVGNFKSGF